MTFLSGRQIEAARIGSSIVTVQCQSPVGSGTITNVLASPKAVYNPTSIQYPWSISFQIETQNVVPTLLLLGPILNYVDRSIVMVAFRAKNRMMQLPRK